MSISESFYALLAGNPTITGALASVDSIFPHMLPQQHDGFPAITYGLAHESDIQLLNGDISETHICRMEVRVWDRSFKSVNDVATIIKGQLVGLSGAAGTNTLVHVSKDSEISLPEERETGLHSIRLEFRIAYY